GVLSQRLVKRADGQGRVAALEIMLNTSYIKQLIEEGSTRDLEKAIMEGRHHNMQTFNQALYDLWSKAVITEVEALASSSTPEDLQLMFRGIKRGTSADETMQPAAGGNKSVLQTMSGRPAPGAPAAGAPGAGGDKKKPSRGFDF